MKDKVPQRLKQLYGGSRSIAKRFSGYLIVIAQDRLTLVTTISPHADSLIAPRSAP